MKISSNIVIASFNRLLQPILNLFVIIYILSRWAIPHRLDFLTFIGKDVLAVGHDVYIIFFNFKHNTELVYVANNEKAGDGVDVIAGMFYSFNTDSYRFINIY